MAFIKKNYLFILTGVLFTLFIVWTILVKTVDVHYIENIGFLGFYNFNIYINDLVKAGNVDLFDKLSTVIMVVAILSILPYAVLGLYQWIKRKSLKEVDPILFILLATYAVSTVFYLILDLMRINYAPYATLEDLQPSYPSSHALCIGVFLIINVSALFNYIKANKVLKCVTIVLVALVAALSFVIRLKSGKHYFTDIIGSLFLVSTLVAAHFATCNILKGKLVR